jgi:hypothetical protein
VPALLNVRNSKEKFRTLQNARERGDAQPKTTRLCAPAPRHRQSANRSGTDVKKFTGTAKKIIVANRAGARSLCL